MRKIKFPFTIINTSVSGFLFASMIALTPSITKAAFTADVEATNNATVKPAGVRTGTSNANFFNAEGSGAGTNASYGVAEFNLATYGITSSDYSSIDSLTVKLTESNASFTHPGSLAFLLTTDLTTTLVAGSTPPNFDATDTTYGLGSQFATTYLLGTGAFSTTGNVNSGTVDSYTFTLSGTAQSYLQSQLNAGGLLRIIITENADPAVAATFAGYNNSTVSGPTLALTYTAVPEPSDFFLVGLGLGSLFLLRKLRRKAASKI